MDLVDTHSTLQPFLNYSWMTPNPSKPSKPSRKQNRCCDQCRKGKRACDAAILEDGLADPNESVTVFHYSDAFGALARCSNCQKTRKPCTFEWLRSQRLSQAMTPIDITPSAKRRRTESSRPNDTQAHTSQHQTDVPTFDLSNATTLDGLRGSQMGVKWDVGDGKVGQHDRSQNLDDVLLDRDSGQGSSLDASSDSIFESPVTEDLSISASFEPDENDSIVNSASLSRRQKRRRRCSARTTYNETTPKSSLSMANKLLSSANSIFLTEGLLRIYHDSFENALACWLTEETCPYSKRSEVSLAAGAGSGSSWNRIYHRVFRLDRLASPVRGRSLTSNEEKAASKALNLAIFSFATQWAQSSKRSKAKYRFAGDSNIAELDEIAMSPTDAEFDRSLQISAWHEAHMALQSSASIESFRVVLAQIVFSLTQRPRQDHELDATDQRVRADINECTPLFSRLETVIDGEGPPIHLDQGLRLIHSLRSRMAMLGAASNTAQPLNDTDRGTIELLFWLGVMFDTLTSAMHQRPLVVSDEDSDICFTNTISAASVADETRVEEDDKAALVPSNEGLWDRYLFSRQHDRLQGVPVRWPCHQDQGASLLRDAAPVKVLLFRKITRIQSLISRNIRGPRIERAVAQALEVYHWWGTLYAPFIEDCISNHDDLPAQIQSWYICLTGHWHLATLLLADLVDIIDGSVPQLGEPIHRHERSSSGFADAFRKENCYALSDLARCACPRKDASFPKSREYHFAVNQGALLTEPWTAVLIRAFAKAGAILLESTTWSQSDPQGSETFKRAEDCCQAIFYLGKKSDQALSAAKILGDALNLRQSNLDIQVHDLGDMLESELWEGFDDISGPFDVDCV